MNPLYYFSLSLSLLLQNLEIRGLLDNAKFNQMLVLAREKLALPLNGEPVGTIRREVLRFAMMLEETLSYIRDYKSQPNFRLVLFLRVIRLFGCNMPFNFPAFFFSNT